MMPRVRGEWGQCAVCGLSAWLYRVEGPTVKKRCLQCWMDAADVGVISVGLYERIRMRVSHKAIVHDAESDAV